MGAWGITMRESDNGLDMLGKVVVVKLIHGGNIFNVPEVKKYLSDSILEGIQRDCRGCSPKEMQKYIAYNYPGSYEQAVVLVAECLVDYLKTGKLEIDRYDRDEPYTLEITKFVYTQDDLDSLQAELEQVLSPESELNNSWAGGSYYAEWTAYIQSLRNTIRDGLKGGK